jgi:hypothetical protein
MNVLNRSALYLSAPYITYPSIHGVMVFILVLIYYLGLNTALLNENFYVPLHSGSIYLSHFGI